MKRVTTLDGWRGIAILLVIVGHAGDRFRGQMWAEQAWLGVDIFFVVSGYIITTKLLEERQKTGTFSIRKFYERRVRRIAPAPIVYLAVLLLLSKHLYDFRFSEVMGCLLLFRNYQEAWHPGGVYTGHFWSLSVEEHFYLIWPAVLLWLKNRWAVWFAGAAAVLCAAWRSYDYASTSWVSTLFGGCDPLPWSHAIRTDTRIDGLMIGSMLALILPKIRLFILRNFPKETPLLCGFPLLLITQRANGKPTLPTYLLIAIALCSTLVVEEGLAHKWLNNRVIVWVGRISFSLYVWQELFLRHPLGYVPAFAMFPYNIVLAFAFAAASYYFVEQRFIRRPETR